MRYLPFSIAQSIFNGLHVIFVPYSVMQVDPGSWLRMVTKYRGKVFSTGCTLSSCPIQSCKWTLALGCEWLPNIAVSQRSFE
ncbi:hypothetical protein AHF37_04812 [Paragonimus kellicotti]|nr:hypothetical protein AHF37_04812 [Paragonimus kellicotti]